MSAVFDIFGQPLVLSLPGAQSGAGLPHGGTTTFHRAQHRPATVQARLVRRILEYAIKHGMGRSEVAGIVGLDELAALPVDARVPVSLSVALWRRITDCTSDHAFGVKLGQATTLRQWGLPGYVLYYSNTLRELLRNLQRYCHLINESVHFEFRSAGSGEAIFAEDPHDVDVCFRYAVDHRFAAIVAAVREAATAEVAPLEVRFPHKRPPSIGHYGRPFPCRLSFSESMPGIVFRERDLDLPVKRSDPVLMSYLEAYAQLVLRKLEGSGSMVELVRSALWKESLTQRPTLEWVASKIGVHPRTLQRRLSNEGSSFGAVLDSLRFELARAYLLEQRLSIGEVAFLLGYSDTSSFHRSFRRWTGRTPREFRRG